MDNFTKLLQFRSLFGKGITREESVRIWGKIYDDKMVYKRNKYVDEKIKIAKENISVLLVWRLVRFVGLSGSVGSGFAKKDDDIDIFVVVRNGSIWLYRALVQIKNIFHRKIRTKGEKDVKDKLCLNLIAEERGLSFDSDIFNFNELMYLVPIYNKEYINFIYSQNGWLEMEYRIKGRNMVTKFKPLKQVNFFLQILNKIFYCFQLVYMKLARHSPNFKRIRNNSKKGRIEFFPKKFREKKIQNYLEEFKSTN